jgi:hypothetical protein
LPQDGEDGEDGEEVGKKGSTFNKVKKNLIKFFLRRNHAFIWFFCAFFDVMRMSVACAGSFLPACDSYVNAVSVYKFDDGETFFFRPLPGPLLPRAWSFYRVK